MRSAGTGRIGERFLWLRQQGRPGLVSFVTAGDPSLSATPAIMRALVDSGSDLVELGVPFSDPVADGPTIQHSSARALDNGVTIPGILAAVQEFRTTDRKTPVVLMGYLNPFLAAGLPEVAARASAAGVDGLIVVDCPLEEHDVIAPCAAAGTGLDLVGLVAPTTSLSRATAIAARASGFLYRISLAGVTGTGMPDTGTLGTAIATLKAGVRLPVAVGFGIRAPGQIADMLSFPAPEGIPDAIVVGSALVRQLSGCSDSEAPGRVARLNAVLAAAVRGRCTGETPRTG